jgi:hypothetical protein
MPRRETQFDRSNSTGSFYWLSCAVTVSNNADWTLVVGTIYGDWASAQLLLWNSAGEMLSKDKFRISPNPAYMSDWSLSFASGGHGCNLLIKNRKEGTKEMHEWTISDSGVVKVETVIPTNDVPSPCIDTSSAWRGGALHVHGRRLF